MFTKIHIFITLCYKTTYKISISTKLTAVLLKGCRLVVVILKGHIGAANTMLIALIQFCAMVYSLFNDFETTAVGECKVNEIDHTVVVEGKGRPSTPAFTGQSK